MLTTNDLIISMNGRCQVWLLDPQLAGAGISPVTGSYSNEWSQTTVAVESQNSTFERTNAPSGPYEVSISGFPGDTVSLDVSFFQTNQLTLTNATWILGTNPVALSIQLNLSSSNALGLQLAAPPPVNVRGFPSNDVCYLAWDAV